MATARRAHGQQFYELARAVHADLTTGEVAASRDRLRALVQSRREQASNSTAPDRSQGETLQRSRDSPFDSIGNVRRDWFTLLWCFQRVHAASVLLAAVPSEVIPAAQQRPYDFLATLVRDHVRFFNAEATEIRGALEEWARRPVDDGDSIKAFLSLVVDLLQGEAVGRWADPVTTDNGEALYELVTATPDLELAGLRESQFNAIHRTTVSRGIDRITLVRRLQAEAKKAPDGIKRATLMKRAERLDTAVATERLADDHGDSTSTSPATPATSHPDRARTRRRPP
ncbi:hypothetical protein [Actinomycetospora aeridis]|uniref:Uncharacterized protein n=1 Tax=Actinomycetospora aeridis TaxID=3129231 RepID=A0ABU8MYK7_9PSEU